MSNRCLSPRDSMKTFLLNKWEQTHRLITDRPITMSWFRDNTNRFVTSFALNSWVNSVIAIIQSNKHRFELILKVIDKHQLHKKDRTINRKRISKKFTLSQFYLLVLSNWRTKDLSASRGNKNKNYLRQQFKMRVRKNRMMNWKMKQWSSHTQLTCLNRVN